MAVYKLAGKDGKGAWFARRSVHEGLGFRKWKLGLQKEFPESLKVQGGPGEGNIRGIGGERVVESISVDGMGQLEGERIRAYLHLHLINYILIILSLPFICPIPRTNDATRFCYIALDFI